MKFIKNIMDSVHGSIKLTEIESKIIDHPLFQRTRNIRQLGTAHLVYPGAVHTRFVHSLGVMHVAGQYYDSLMNNFNRDQSYYDLKQLVRISALLHDIGHGPFSHIFEKTFGDLKVRDIENNEIIFDFDHINKSERESYLNSALHHEHLSLAMIYKILDEIKDVPELFHARNICSILDKKIQRNRGLDILLKNIIEKNQINETPELKESFLNCIRSIVSGEFDADRMDYLQRDSLHCGVKLTGIDTAHIFESMKIQKSGDLFHILINRNCIASLEQMLISRKFMFDQVYNHKICMVFDWILENIFMDLKKGDRIKFIENYDGFIVQSDGYIISKIKECVQNQDLDPNKANFYKAFLTRTKPLNLRYETIDSLEENTEERFKKDHKDLNILDIPLKVITKLDYGKPGNLFRVLNKNYDNPQKLESYLQITRDGFYKKRRKMLLAFEDINSQKFTKILEGKEKIFLPNLTIVAS